MLIKVGPCQWVLLDTIARDQMVACILDMIRELKGEHHA